MNYATLSKSKHQEHWKMLLVKTTYQKLFMSRSFYRENESIKSLNPNASTGTDEITPKIIKISSKVIKSYVEQGSK